MRKGWWRVGSPPFNTKTKWKLWYMSLPHSTSSPIYSHRPNWSNSELVTPQLLRTILTTTAFVKEGKGSKGRKKLMPRVLFTELQRQAPARAPSPWRMPQQPEETVGSGNVENGDDSCHPTFTTSNRHCSKSGHGWEVTIESERRLRERNRATQTLPFKSISLNKPNSFTTLSYTFLCYRLWMINNSSPRPIYSPKISALRK